TSGRVVQLRVGNEPKPCASGGRELVDQHRCTVRRKNQKGVGAGGPCGPQPFPSHLVESVVVAEEQSLVLEGHGCASDGRRFPARSPRRGCTHCAPPEAEGKSPIGRRGRKREGHMWVQRWEADISRASTSFSPPWLRDA